MIVGFNHNVMYRGTAFHVQTEDGGEKSPSLVTLLYYGGTIIASQKTSYADISAVENLNQVVEDLAKEQHKGMLRRLTRGEFDQKICALDIPLQGVEAAVVSSAETAEAAEAPAAATSPAPEAPEAATPDPVHASTPLIEPPPPVADQPQSDLDRLIYAYLTASDA